MQRTVHRRQLLADVGRGMLAASVGFSAALDFGFVNRAWAEDGETPLDFGADEGLVCLMQETAPDALQRLLVERLAQGTPLVDLVRAGALANARSFGGEDYIGFHTMMAMAPAYAMSRELPADRAALPVLKVLYRNASRLQETGGRSNEVLRQVAALSTGQGAVSAEDLRAAARAQDPQRAEQIFATLAAAGPDALFNALLLEVEDNTEVHRVALPYRAWDLLGVIGSQHAHTLLRQSLRYCVKNEKHCGTEVRDTLARVFDEHQLAGRTPGTRTGDDAWVQSLSMVFFTARPEDAACAAGAALAEGYSADAITEAVALAANQLVLRDHGRPDKYAAANKPAGSVHGDSIGVHACDAVNAWRNIARAANPHNQMAAAILAAFEVARDRAGSGWGGEQFLIWQPRPWAEDLQAVAASDSPTALQETEDAIQSNDQVRAAAAMQRYGELGGDPRAAFDLLLKFAISEDGALHAEKYYRTTSQEYAEARPAFRHRQLVALARVTASEHGYPAPGYQDARGLLGIG